MEKRLIINSKECIADGYPTYEIYSADNTIVYSTDSKYSIMMMLNMMNLKIDHKFDLEHEEPLNSYNMVLTLIKDKNENN